MKNVSKFSPLHSFKTSVFQCVVILVLLTATLSCNAQKATTESDTTAKARPERGQRPSLDEIFEMDTNKDGKLAKSEVKGPLLRDFAKIDTDKDGFLSRKEVGNAPKPEGGQRPHAIINSIHDDKLIILLGLFCLPLSTYAHQPDLSSTILAEKGENEWILQIRAALTAFEYEVEARYGESAYTTPEEFRELVAKYLREELLVRFNGDQATVLERRHGQSRARNDGHLSTLLSAGRRSVRAVE